MEILQTIWNALTNENQILLNIISVPMTFLEVSLIFLLFSTILNMSCSKKQSVLYVVFFSMASLVSTYLIPTPYNTFINLIAFPALVYFILRTNALKSILAVLTSYITFFFIGTPLVILYSLIFKINSNIFFNIPIYKMIYSLTLYVVLFTIYKVLKKFNLRITLFDKFDTWSYNILIINFIVGILSIAIQAYTEYLYTDYIPTHLIFISLTILLFYFLISLYSLYRTSQLEKTKQMLAEEKMYNKTLSTLHDNIRGFKHDFHNMVQAIGGYVSSNNMEGLKTYYKDLMGDCQTNNNLAVLNPELINNPAIYSLLADKYYKSDELGIKINLEVFADLSNLNIKMYELTRILGVLLDNSIEAAAKCENKLINITFRKDKKTNRDLIIIQNTYINKDVNIDRIFEKGYTSKQDKDNKDDCENTKEAKTHGLGLWEVRKYLKKNTNLDLFTTKNDEFFTQQFEIYN